MGGQDGEEEHHHPNDDHNGQDGEEEEEEDCHDDHDIASVASFWGNSTALLISFLRLSGLIILMIFQIKD